MNPGDISRVSEKRRHAIYFTALRSIPVRTELFITLIRRSCQRKETQQTIDKTLLTTLPRSTFAATQANAASK